MTGLLDTAARLLVASSFATAVFATTPAIDNGLKVEISMAKGLLNGSTDGRISLMFAPAGVDPLTDTEVDSSPNKFFGKNVFNYAGGDSVTLSGGSGVNTRLGVYGWPNVSLSDVSPGNYTVQAFLNLYEKVTRSDGSTVSVRFPCGDGALPLAGPGSLSTPPTNVTVSGSNQTIQLNFDSVLPSIHFNGTEIGGCSQGNYEDTELLKHVKIRSDVLSSFWNRDM